MSFLPLGLTPHIGVFDMPKALAFYRDIVGFSVVSASHRSRDREGPVFSLDVAAFRRSRNDAEYAIRFHEQPPDPPTKTSKNVVFYIGCSDVELAYQELTKRGL